MPSVPCLKDRDPGQLLLRQAAFLCRLPKFFLNPGFDRNYEGLTGDIAYNPQLQRAACVDIRYTLFIIDKFAGAKHLVDEMTIVE